jgi:hypothetical protein
VTRNCLSKPDLRQACRRIDIQEPGITKQDTEQDSGEWYGPGAKSRVSRGGREREWGGEVRGKDKVRMIDDQTSIKHHMVTHGPSEFE